MVQSNVDRVEKIILLGTEGKRKIYFEKACDVDYSFYSYENVDQLLGRTDLQDVMVKIDPPAIKSAKLTDIDVFTEHYKSMMQQISKLPVFGFYNTPAAILLCLDKKKCKQILLENGILVTDSFDVSCKDHAQLLTFMDRQRLSQIFVKPVNGAGAAGVTAVRFSKNQNKLWIYTCATISENGLMNTKKLMRLENEEAKAYLDLLLRSECIIEKWHAKDQFEKYCFDLRVVVNDGKVVYILPRLSKGPITNLHLNNHAEYYEKLQLPDQLTKEISSLCIKAVSCIPGLRGAGIDVLIEHGKPRIIEMNGQGDLIYQDIYEDNRIYKSQVASMKKLLSEKNR